ncbi:MAG TPA: hypothetical protein VFL86_23175 [Burkholderiaceae bacterium]|nr:hypothetical protein [Burkholderiaceae bacterium]
MNLSKTTWWHAVTGALLCGFLTPAVHAQNGDPEALNDAPVELPQPPKIKLVLGFGVTFGGDTLGSLAFSTGTVEDVKAGQLLLMYGGLQYQATPRLSVQGTFGYHVDDATASNAQIRFSRFPMEVLVRHHINEQWLVGGGVRLVLGAEASARQDGFGSGTLSFDNAVGAVIEGEYRSAPNLGWKLRYVSEKYTVQGQSSTTVDGSHVGLLLNWYL